jgi:hypothetical protein
MLSLTFTRSNSVSASLRTVTKKKYAQLPKNRVLPDGSIPKPLLDWQGGLCTLPHVNIHCVLFPA